MICWPFKSRRRKLQEQHEELTRLLMQIANAALKYRGPANNIHQRKAHARHLDRLLAEYKKKMYWN